MGTSPTGYFPKYKLWYIELNQFSHHSMCLYLSTLKVVILISPSPLNIVISFTTQCRYFYHYAMWLSPSPPKCDYLHHNSMWLSLSPLNVVISITTQCGYLYHHLMWLSLSPLNVVISIIT